MRQRDLIKLNVFFSQWQGASAFMNRYVDDHDRLTIGLTRTGAPAESIGVSFMNCFFISGPTRWNSAQLICEVYGREDGYVGLEVQDARSGFVLRCGGPVIIGDGDAIVPSE